MDVLVDTNVLLRSVQPRHPQFPESIAAVAALAQRNDQVCFCPQNIAEFWSVATRPLESNGLGLSHQQALNEVLGIESSLTLLPDVPQIYAVWKRLVTDHHVRGVKVYDARLVAIMAVYGVENILTFNADDFKRYPNIKALLPASVIAVP